MNLTEEEILLVEKMGATHFSVRETLIALGLDSSVRSVENVYIEQGPFYTAYTRGKLMSELEVREAIFRAAKDGSSPAQTLARQIITELRANDVTG